MSAASSFREEDARASTLAEAVALFRVSQRMTEVQLRRLTRLEGGLVRLLDLIDESRDLVARGQQMQLDALRLYARLSAR
jgi:hypothetical protein